MLQQFREDNLEVYKSVESTGVHYARNSDVLIHKLACTDWVRMEGILDMLSIYVFHGPGSSRFVTCSRLLMNLQEGVWSSGYARDADKFTSLTTQYNSNTPVGHT